MLARRSLKQGFKVCGIQIETTSDKEANMRSAMLYLDKAAENGVNVACFHEYFMTGPPHKGHSKDQINQMSEPIPGPTTNFLAEKAKEHKMYIVAGSIVEIEDGKLYNTSTLIGPDGDIVGKYSKTHPENYVGKYELGSGISAKSEYPVFDTQFGRVGIMIDMDGAVPEVSRILSIRGAEVIFWPIQWSMRWARLIDKIACAHAYFTQSYVVAANRVGKREQQYGLYPLLYGGGSMVADPEGNVLAGASWHYPGIAVAEIDLEFLRSWRKEIVPRDYPISRRPETYGVITGKT